MLCDKLRRKIHFACHSQDIFFCLTTTITIDLSVALKQQGVVYEFRIVAAWRHNAIEFWKVTVREHTPMHTGDRNRCGP